MPAFNTPVPASRLRIGLTPWQISTDMQAEALCRQAELAESWGYHSFWLPESHFAGARSIPDPLLLLAAIAARTDTIRLGTTSYLLPIRHPLQAAEQVAVLDQLSGGRIILGLGRGFQANMLDAYKVKSSEKRAIFEQVLSKMRSAWAGDPVGSDKFASILAPLPRQQPHPPLWMAAFGPKALQQAASLGMPYLASPMESMQDLERNLLVYHQALDDCGNEHPKDIAVMRTVFINSDESVCERVREQLQLLAPEQANQGADVVDQSCLIGTLESVTTQLNEYRDRLKMNYLVAVQPRIPGLQPQWQEDSLMQLINLQANAAVPPSMSRG